MTSEKSYKYDPKNRVVQEKSIFPMTLNSPEKKNEEKKEKKNYNRDDESIITRFNIIECAIKLGWINKAKQIG